jgi:hypothetical protein
MFKQERLTVLSIAVLLALLVAAFMPLTVLAQDGTPPPEVPAVEEVLPPVVEEVLTMPEVLDVTPEGTDLVVLDENGQPLPLASEAAAATLIAGDPMWCPDGSTPADGVAGGCTLAFTKFTGEGGLIEALNANPTIYGGSGTIYVAYDYNATVAGDAGNDIVFDYGNIGLTDLIFQGGWDFASNSVVGTSTFDLGEKSGLVFLDWGDYASPADLALKNINIINSAGLFIGTSAQVTENSTPHVTTADVTLINVNVSNTDFGTEVNTTGDVTVIASAFNSNGNSDESGRATGLDIASDGMVTLTGVTASYNNGDGVDIYGYYNEAPSSVLIENSVFDGNHSLDEDWGFGVWLEGGDPTVKCSQFSNNEYGLGVYGSGTFTTDSNTFSDNRIYDIVYSDDITLVQANSGCGGDNGERGFTAQNNLVPQSFVPAPIIATSADLALDGLPGALPDGKTFAAAANVKLTQDGAEVGASSVGVEASIEIPAGMEAPFTLLFWDGSKWVEFAFTVVDGKVVFLVTSPGIFVLVSP